MMRFKVAVMSVIPLKSILSKNLGIFGIFSAFSIEISNTTPKNSIKNTHSRFAFIYDFLGGAIRGKR